MAECPRIGKLIGGCKFSPRYDATAPSPEHIRALTEEQGYLLESDIGAMRSAIYVRDVCERCGKTVERN